MSDLFSSPDALRTAFGDGLERLAAEGGVGSFVLAVANARFDPLLWHRLKVPLSTRFASLCAGYRAQLAEGQPLGGAPDDVEVFLKLALLGVEELAPLVQREVGPWEVQCNPLRSLRPPRLSGAQVPGLRRPFEPDTFNFNKPFMAAEALWEGTLLERPVTLYYNKFPFVPLHGLLVPEREAGHPQFLDAAMHEYLWGLTAELGPRLPGLGFGYNALAAGASVNHLHFQLFVRPDPLPVEVPRWVHTGGTESYPAPVQRFSSAVATWESIERLHGEGRPYNLLYRPGHAYLTPRRPQGGDSLPPWCGGLTWYEMAGGFVTFSRNGFDSLESDSLAVLLRGDSASG